VKPLRIAILTTDKRDHDRDYANPVPGFGTAPAALLQGFARLLEAEVHVVSCVHRPVISPEKIAPNIFYHSLVVPKLGWMRSLYFGCSRAARKKLRELSPDIVHGQGTELDCALNAVRSGFPNVLTIHGNMRLIAEVNHARPFSFLWLAARLEKRTLPRTDGVVCITNYTRAAVEKLAPRTWVLPNAVDGEFFHVHAAPDKSEPPVGLCVGTICLRKNQNEFIRSLDSLAARKKFKLIFLGEVANDDYGREFLELVKGRSWCEHAGFAGRTDLQKYFKRAAFLALPTLEDNCPMTVLEAMAAGVPVLASAVGGVPDLIEPEVTGLFCDPLKPETFSHQLARLLEDAALSTRLAAAAKIAALKKFHPEAIARRHLEIYREVLAGK
jgi:glycosyltransferase involved in cell wall biosynthesis